MKIIIITGQTATGKTKFAQKLAQEYNAEIVNCDSRQIYKKLDIITGKDLSKGSDFDIVQNLNNLNIGHYQISKTPPPPNRLGTPLTKRRPKHPFYSPLVREVQGCFNTNIWLYDIVDPKQYFSSFDYSKCASYVINLLAAKNKTVIMAGGTYLYLYHLLYGIETENIAPDWKLRKELANKSIGQLQIILKKLNPQLTNQLSRSEINNPQRLIRKIEILASTKGQLHTPELKFRLKPFFLNYQIEFVGLQFINKAKLKQAITNRVEDRLKKGAIEEVQNLIKQGYSEADPGLRTIGYNQIIQYLKCQITKEEAIKQWITKEIQYAKRQFTFMKKDPHIHWQNV